MAISFTCNCSQSFTVADSYAGQQTRCPKCRKQLVVPNLPPKIVDVEVEVFGFRDPASQSTQAVDAARFAMTTAERKDAEDAAKTAHVQQRGNGTGLDTDTLGYIVAGVVIGTIGITEL